MVRSAKSNMLSALVVPEQMVKYQQAEMIAGRAIGPFLLPYHSRESFCGYTEEKFAFSNWSSGPCSHGCRSGKNFPRWLVHTACKPNQLDHWVRLTRVQVGGGSPFWGISCISTHSLSCFSVSLATDASGSWGCGAYWSPLWVCCPWNGLWSQVGITEKELLPIVQSGAESGLTSACGNYVITRRWSTSAHPGLAETPSLHICYGTCTCSLHTGM